MATTPKLGMPELTHNEYNGEVTHNEALQIMDLHGQGIVVNHAQASQPGDPVDEGAAYILSVAWGGAAINDVGHYYNGAWHFYTPVNGWRMYSLVNNGLYYFDGSVWVLYVAATIPTPTFGQAADDSGVGGIPTQTLANGVAEPLAGFNAIVPVQDMTVGLSGNDVSFTIQSGHEGYYRAVASITLQADANGSFLFRFYVNGSPSGVGFLINLENKDTDYASGTINVLTDTLSAGDVVELYIEAQQNCDVDYASCIMNMALISR